MILKTHGNHFLSTPSFKRNRNSLISLHFQTKTVNKFFNLYIEGINMLLSERAEIGAMLDARGGNLDALIRDLS